MTEANHNPASSETPSPPREAESNPCVTNLVLLVLVAGLGLWVWQGEGQTKTTEQIKVEETQVFQIQHGFAALQAKHIELVRGDERLVFTREVSAKELAGDYSDMDTDQGHKAPVGWKLTTPVEDRGDDVRIFRLLSRMAQLRAISVLKGEETEQVKFGDVSVRCTVERKTQDPVTFEIGAPRGGEVPVRLLPPSDPPLLYLVPEAFHGEFMQPSWAWRNKVFFPLQLDAVVRADLLVAGAGPGGGERAISVARGQRGWRVGGPQGDLAERSEAEELVNTMRQMSAISVTHDAPDAATLQTCGLTPPQLLCRLTDARGEVLEVEIGDWIEGRVKERYARVKARPQTIYAVHGVDLQKRIELPPETFLAPELFPCEGGAQVVKRVGAQIRDGVRWQVEERGDEGWRFSEEGFDVEKSAIDALLKSLLALKIKTRLPQGTPAEELGLDEPGLRIELWEGEYRHVVNLGDQVEPGVFVAERLVPSTEGEPVRYRYHVEFGALTADLAEAPLDLLARTIYQASSWDARTLELLGDDGRKLLVARFVQHDPNNAQAGSEWRVEGQPGASSDKFKAYVKSFDEVNVQRYEARAKDADLAKYGLDKPETLTIELLSFEGGKKTLTKRTLYLGDRVGRSIYAMAQGGAAIGVIDATFRDRIARGFGEESKLLELDVWKVRRVYVERDGLPAWEATKPDVNWRWDADWKSESEGGGMPSAAYTALEDLLEARRLFGEIQVSRSEDATPERVKATGLDAPSMKIVFVSRAQGQTETQTHTLLIGDRREARERWAMLEGGKTLGVLFDEPLARLEALIAKFPGKAPFPPLR